MADPKATPISALPKGPTGQGEDDQQFMQKILNQMNNDSQESESAYQQAQQSYNQHQFAVNHGQQHEINQENIARAQAQQAQYEQMEDDQYDQQYQYQEEPQLSAFDKIKLELRQPLLFLALFVVLMSSYNFVVPYFTKYISANQKFQYYGTALILGLVGAILFYSINKFVL